MQRHQREHWATKFGFVMAAIGSSIGLGTLWKFPYVTGKNGGGIFVLIYLGCTLFLGIPLLISELLLGRKAQLGPVGTFSSLTEKGRGWTMIGWLAVLSPLLILTYYDVVAGWGLNYVLLSLNNFYQGRTPEQVGAVFTTLYQSGDISIFFHLLFTGITMGMVYQGIQKGIEFWVRTMMMGLFALLLGMLIYSATMPGFMEAARFIFYPDFSQIHPSGILEALGLSFFTLSLGQGVMFTYGSYLQPTDDIPKTAGIVGLADIFVSLLAGLVIFPIVFTFHSHTGQGVGLVFETLPLLFSQVPGALTLSVAFFVLFVFTALTSSVALLEVVVATCIDQYGWSRKRSVLIAGLIVFVLGIPCALSGSNSLFRNWSTMYGKTYFETVDFFVNSWLLPIIGLATSILIGWKLNRQEIREQFRSGSALGFLFRGWYFFIRWVVPIAIVVILLQEGGVIDVDKVFHPSGGR